VSDCTTLTESAAAGVAPALRAVDCLANETTASAFGRLFGSANEGGGGALLPALTVLMTLYVAFFAFSLMTGRSRIGLSALTPRMMTLGVVLTLATSWVAYQSLVWNLAIGAPDQIASVLMGTKGSATQVFADRIDLIFAVIAQIGETVGGSAQGAAQQAGQGSFTPGNLMWLSAVLLLLGTVGILVTARIALAVLLALGPVFVIFAIFPGTRGLTAGWLRGVVLTAVTPLFVVLGGGIMLELMMPVVANLQGVNGVDARASLALFTIACVHLALMAMVLKVCGSLVGGWQVFGLAQREGDSSSAPQVQQSAPAAQTVETFAPAQTRASPPARRLPASAFAVAGSQHESTRTSDAPTVRVANGGRTVITHQAGTGPALPPRQGSRARGIGSRFQAPTRKVREMAR
jgi:type IV secretion system protein VirB6